MILNTDFDSINDIFSQWNPIGVPDNIAKDEYKEYVASVFKYKQNYLGLVSYLENIVTDFLEMDLDLDGRKEITYYSFLIFKILNEA